MDMLLCILIAYCICGYASVSKSLNAPPLERPFWAMKPTIGKRLLYTITWISSQSIENYQSTRQLGRSISYGLLASFQQLAWTSIVLYGVYLATSSYIDNTALQLITVSAIFFVALFVLTPISTILIIPTTFFFGMIIDLFFPLKDNKIQQRERDWSTSLNDKFLKEIESWPTKQANAAINLIRSLIDKNHGQIDEYVDQLTVKQLQYVNEYIEKDLNL